MGKITNYFNKKINNYFKARRINFSEIKRNSLLVSKSSISDYYYGYLGKNSELVNKIEDFTTMWSDPILFNALEFTVDDATQYSSMTRKRVWSAIKNKNQQKHAEELFADLNIDEECWRHYARLGMFGNCPIRIYYKNPDFTGGIINIEVEENIFRYVPIELNGVLVKYIDKYTDDLLEPFEVVFGRINVLSTVGYVDNYYDITLKKGKHEGIIKNTFQHGTSLFDNVRRVWRQLKLLEDNMILTRLDRTPLVRIFKVRTEGLTTQSTIDMIDYYSDLLNTNDRTLSVNDDILKGTNGQVGFGTNIMIPVEEKGDLEVDQFGGDADVSHIVDVDYFKTKFYAGLKVPREYLGLSEDRGLSIGDNSLQRKDIRYSRTVKKLQFGGMKMYKDITFFHLLSLGDDVKYDDVNIIMNVVSTAEDEEMKNALETSMDSVSTFIDLMNDIKDFLIDNSVNDKTREYLLDYLTTRILNTNDFDFKRFFGDLIKTDDGTITETVKYNIIFNEKFIDPIKCFVENRKCLSRIPKFQCDKNLKFCGEALKNKSSRYIIENVNTNLKIKDLNALLNKTTAFSVGIFNLTHEAFDIKMAGYDIVNKKIIQNKDIVKNIVFTEEIFEKRHILNGVDSNKKITLYNIKDKLYCNYNNGCKLFRNVFHKNKNIFEVIKLEKIKK